MLGELPGAGLPPGLAEVEVSGLQYDSRRIRPGDVFFAFPGEHVDGHQFIHPALQAGAVAIVSERAAPQDRHDSWVQVPHGREALAIASLNFYGRPDHRLCLVGVTGTNGKTTTTHLIDAILEESGLITALLGTIEHKVGRRHLAAVNTTPESLDLVHYFVELEQQGGTHAVLEVSSHALELRRVFGMDFHTAVFTNLSQDHLDFHGDMQSYARAKQRLFEGAGGAVPRYGVINADDSLGKDLLKMAGFESLSYGRSSGAMIVPEDLQAGPQGLRVQVATPRGKLLVESKLRGEFNVYNILAAVGAALSLDIDLEVVGRGIARCERVAGRFESVEEGQPFLVIVDYAHTEDALKHLIQAGRALLTAQKPPARVITVFGCGGDRDRSKRPAMGGVAGRLSDLVILTSDNPRTEDPLLIINDIQVGLQRVDARYETEPDRAKAIRKALYEARPNDIVLIAGKGHEAYQTIGSESIPFDDRQVARGVLQEMGYTSKRPSGDGDTP